MEFYRYSSTLNDTVQDGHRISISLIKDGISLMLERVHLLPSNNLSFESIIVDPLVLNIEEIRTPPESSWYSGTQGDVASVLLDNGEEILFATGTSGTMFYIHKRENRYAGSFTLFGPFTGTLNQMLDGRHHGLESYVNFDYQIYGLLAENYLTNGFNMIFPTFDQVRIHPDDFGNLTAAAEAFVAAKETNNE